MELTVAVATFGDLSWMDLARERAIPSTDHPVVYAHGRTLHEARNAALAMVDTEWVCHLDADDELEPGYFDRMAEGTADVRAPAVRYVTENSWPSPRVPVVAGHGHRCVASCLIHGNWLVIGSVARTDLLRSVGGWRDFDWSEDWDLWLRCHLAGATFEAVPQAVYRAHVRADSRNRGQSQEAKNAAHHAIARANGIAA